MGESKGATPVVSSGKPSKFKRFPSVEISSEKPFNSNQTEIDDIYQIDIVACAKTKEGSK
jgi:hypothetical protein